jgi:hypothetical protein
MSTLPFERDHASTREKVLATEMYRYRIKK